MSSFHDPLWTYVSFFPFSYFWENLGRVPPIILTIPEPARRKYQQCLTGQHIYAHIISYHSHTGLPIPNKSYKGVRTYLSYRTSGHTCPFNDLSYYIFVSTFSFVLQLYILIVFHYSCLTWHTSFAPFLTCVLRSFQCHRSLSSADVVLQLKSNVSIRNFISYVWALSHDLRYERKVTS